MDLSRKRVLVVGGGSGIGFAVAELAAQAGAAVVIASSNQARVAAAAKQLGDKVVAHRLDITDEPMVAAFFEAQLRGMVSGVEELAVDVRQQVARRERVDSDLVAGQFEREQFGQLREACLRGCVRGDVARRARSGYSGTGPLQRFRRAPARFPQP